MEVLSRRRTKDTPSPSRQTAPPVYTTLLNKYYVDEAYDYAFTGRRKVGDVRLGVMGLGEASSWFDSHVIDGTVNGAGWITRLSGNDFQLVGQVDHRRSAGEWPGDSCADVVLSRALAAVGPGAVVCAGDGDWAGRIRFLLRSAVSKRGLLTTED